jgi:hypothetical protein
MLALTLICLHGVHRNSFNAGRKENKTPTPPNPINNSTHNLQPANSYKWTHLTPKTASVVPPEDGSLTPETCRGLDTIKWLWKCIKLVTLLWCIMTHGQQYIYIYIYIYIQVYKDRFTAVDSILSSLLIITHWSPYSIKKNVHCITSTAVKRYVQTCVATTRCQNSICLDSSKTWGWEKGAMGLSALAASGLRP